MAYPKSNVCTILLRKISTKFNADCTVNRESVIPKRLMGNHAQRLNKLKSHEEKTHMNKLWKKLIALAVIVSLMVMAVVPTFAQSGVLSEIPVTGTLADGGTFEGVLSITNFAYQNGQLL